MLSTWWDHKNDIHLEEVIEVIKSLTDTQIDNLTQTNQLLIALTEDALCQLSQPKF